MVCSKRAVLVVESPHPVGRHWSHNVLEYRTFSQATHFINAQWQIHVLAISVLSLWCQMFFGDIMIWIYDIQSGRIRFLKFCHYDPNNYQYFNPNSNT